MNSQFEVERMIFFPSSTSSGSKFDNKQVWEAWNKAKVLFGIWCLGAWKGR